MDKPINIPVTLYKGCCPSQPINFSGLKALLKWGMQNNLDGLTSGFGEDRFGDKQPLYRIEYVQDSLSCRWGYAGLAYSLEYGYETEEIFEQDTQTILRWLYDKCVEEK